MVKNRNQRDTVVLLILFITVVAIWVISYYLIGIVFPGKLESRAQFGDTFGAVNSLFSGLALAGIIYTIMLQRMELKLQREELTATREEFQVQNATAKRQRFENSFFRLLEFLNSMPQSFKFKDEVGVEYHGRDFFKGLIQKGLVFDLNRHDGDDFYYIAEGFSAAFNETEHFLGPWFSSIEKILILIDKESELKKDEKVFYVSILRSQLTTHEMIAIGFYTIFSIIPENSLGYYVKKYQFLRENDIFRSHLPDQIMKSYLEKGIGFYAPPYEGIDGDDIN